MRGFYIVVDLGGTNLRVAALAEEGILELRRWPSIAKVEAQEGLSLLKERVGELKEEGARRRWRPMGVAIGVPGLIDGEGLLVHSPHLRAYEGVNFLEELQELGMPLLLENDANLYALGEGFRGAAKGKSHYCCLTLGTGVGGGVVIGGRLLKGAQGVASEVGHMVIDEDGVQCYCGSRGCLEAYASGSAILRMAVEEGLEVSSAKEVSELATAGDERAQRVFQEMGRYLGVGLANLVNLFNPEMIVLGGKVAEAWPLFAPRALEEMASRAFSYAAKGVQVRRAHLGDEAALWGGLSLLLGLEDGE